MRVAVITGASSGLGWEYALAADRENARVQERGKSLRYDEIWAIARRRERLEALAQACKTPMRIFTLDLTDRETAQKVVDALKDADAQVGLLVNAAGFGKFGTCDDLTQREVDDMVDLNCRAVVDMTQRLLPYMSRGSRIIEVASSAAFQPLPGLGVYAATKSFVLSYTRSLRFELRGRGIRTTAVCPIWVKTEFIKVARQTENGTTVRHPFPQISARHVVRWSTLINRINYPVATCAISSCAMRIASKIVPAPLIMWIWEGLRRI